MARPVRSLALVATLVTMFPAAALADDAGDDREKGAAPGSSASSDGSSTTAPTAPSPTASGGGEARVTPPQAPARAPARAPEPPRELPLPDVATAEQYKGIIEIVEERVKDRTADLSDVHRLAAMKADYAERAHMRNPALAATGVFLTVTGVSASILGLALAIGGANTGSRGSWDFGALVPIGLAGVAGGIGIAVGGAKLYSYGAASELEPPKQPQPNRVTLHLSPFGAAGSF
jgi:hypothetical protein